MAYTKILNYAFNRGIISPLGLARFDLKRLALSAQIMVNWICRTLGSMMLRPGLAFIDTTFSNAKAVHIPFIKSIPDTAIIELTNNLMRVRVAEAIISRVAVSTAITNGTFSGNITGWTQNDDTGGLSQWATGNFMSLSGNKTARGIRFQNVTVSGGDQGKEHALRIVINKGYVTLRVGTTNGDDSYINNTTLYVGTHSLAFTPTGNFTIQVSSSTVYASLITSIAIEGSGAMTIATAWTTAMLPVLRWAESADVVFVTSDGTVKQKRIERRSTRSWSVVDYYADDGPFLNQNVDTSLILSASALTGDITLTANRPFFKSGHNGALFQLISQNGSSVGFTSAGKQQWSDPILVTGVSTNGGRNLTINTTGTWVGTLVLQYSVGAPGAWVDSGQAFTTNQTNLVYNDGFNNQSIYYRIGFENTYTSGSAICTLSFSVASTTPGIVRVDQVNSSTSVNAHVLTALSGLTTLAGTAASGRITFTVNPADMDTIQLNGVTWTFVAAGPTGNQTLIGVSLGATMTQLAADLTASVNASLTVASYAATSTAINITYNSIGTGGNAYTLASGALNGIPSGPTLSGGVGATTGVGTALWSQGLWSGVNGYPTAIGFYEGRLWQLGADYVAGSVSDAYGSYDQTLVGDSGPIIRTIADGPVSIINWMLGLQRLLVGCDGNEQSVRSSTLDDPLTPTNFNIKSPSTRGSAAVAAVKIDTNGVFVQRGDPATGNTSGTRLLEISYQGFYAIVDYTTADLSEFCPELVAIGINKIAVQRKIDTRIHCLLNDGTVAVCVYDPLEKEKGWMLVTTPGTVEDVFVMPGGIEDKVYYVVNRTINGATKRYLERWALESECTGLPMAKNSDSHIVYSGSAVTTITGLGSLEAATVVVWGWNTSSPFTVTMPDGTTQTVGRDLGTFTVSSGQITGLPAAVTDAVIGLAYTAQWQSVKLTQTVHDGTSMGCAKNIDQLGVVLGSTHCQGLQYGPNFSTLESMPLVESGGFTLDTNTVWSSYDAESVSFDGDWSPNSRLCLQAASPRPCTLLSANIGVETSDR